MTFKLFILVSLFLALAHGNVNLDGYEVLSIDSNTLQNSIEIATNSRIALKFEGNPTTGYNWYIKNSDVLKTSKIVSVLNLNEENSGEFQEKEHERNVAGVGGWVYFKFQGLANGTENIQFVYKRLWETEPIKTVGVELRVIEIKENL